MRDTLPIDDVLPEVVAALRGGNLVLEAPPGAGKTTRVPPAVLEAGIAGDGRVVVLEPRRVAARAASRRIAAERGWSVGREVGWQIRFERNFTRDTRILFLTEGVLVQRLQSDPFLEGIGSVLFDEFHERSLFADLSLALVRRVQREARPDLRLVAMSATLAPEVAGLLAAFLDAKVVRSPGRLYPVAVEYLDAPPVDTPLATLVARGVRRGVEATGGDLLVFLPGVGEIRRAEEAIAPLARDRDLLLVPLFGDLPGEEQDRALRRAERRRVILATNVAETSITIDGVSGVVDTGLVKELEADPASGLERLVLRRISRASAEQRAGRAGRQAPGWCLRLWSEYEQRSLQERTRPEIARADLAWTALQLHAWGERDLAAFPWFEAPDAAALARAEKTLRAVGALDIDGTISAAGKSMAALPLHPRLAKLVLEGEAAGVGDEAALVAALLSERDPTLALRRAHGAGTSESDLLNAVDSLRSATRGGESTPVFRTRDQIRDIVRRRGASGFDAAPRSPADDSELRLRRAIASAWLDRLCRRREAGGDRAVMVGGRGVRLARESAVRNAGLFVAVELDDREGVRSEALVRRASAVERAWLPAERTTSGVELAFDEERERVTAFQRTRFEDLVLEEKEVPIPDAAAAAACLVEAAALRLERALPGDDPDWSSLLDRIRFLRRHLPELELPEPDSTLLTDLLSSLAERARSFEALRRAPWSDALLGLLAHAQRQALEREAPERLEVPSGSRLRLDYRGERPVLAARIQELFGLAETPRLARGRVPVLLHLLAPSGRPQQVTDDLASFWSRTYPEVRKELAGRYPKHSWPADPWSAKAEKRPRKRT